MDTNLHLYAIRTDGALDRIVALKQYLQHEQTFISAFGKKIKQVLIKKNRHYKP
jgi:hypothetical protein